MIELSKFSAKDFREYQSWLQDPTLAAILGSITEEWLTYILSDKSGAEWTLKENGTLLVVIGITFPTVQNQYYVINNICCNPKLIRRNYASKALEMLIDQYKLIKEQYWVAYVHQNNLTAQLFFKKNKWENNVSMDDDEYKKYVYRLEANI